MSDKCKRKWGVTIGGYHGEDILAECGCKRYTAEVCPEELDRWEIDRRINATERLSAKVARRNAVILRLNAEKLSYGKQTQGYADSVDLFAYADTLENK